jgi:uncharacterized protein YcbK (DUF882 family)
MWEDKIKDISRRNIMKAGLTSLIAAPILSSMSAPAMAARIPMPDEGAFKISFRNVHTGESFNGVYRVGSKYMPDAFEKINYVLRDFRTGEVFPIDPRTMDILYMMHKKSGSKYNFEILSGYRSPKTNAMLRRTSTGVARNSFHLTGQAIDIRLPYYRTSNLQKIAQNLRAGGVGYYNKSNFVHVDTGKVRFWNDISQD